jgi:hypothetical protein
MLFAPLPAACGPGKGPNGPPPPPSTSASTSASTATEDSGGPVCKRVCTVQTKCSKDVAHDLEACTMKCLPIARVLDAEVLDHMVSCVEKKSPATCDDSDAGVAARKHLIGSCVIEATEARVEQARENISLFAKAFCDRTASCGSATGAISPSECLGEAKGQIMSTEGDSSGGLYGSFRPEKVDEMLLCLAGPCDQRKERADEDVERCLTGVLVKAAESP